MEQLLFLFQSKSLLLRTAHCFFTIMFVEDGFTDTDALRRNFYEFVVVDPFQGFFQAHFLRRREAECFIRCGGTGVGQVFLLARVDVDVDVAVAFAYDLAKIDFFTRFDEHRAAVLQVEDAIARRRARFKGN